MTYSEKIDIEISILKAFLYGQLSLYKIEFAETGNNKYLEVMHKLNRTIKLIEYMQSNTYVLAKKLKELKSK